jgi:hypothetical protein
VLEPAKPVLHTLSPLRGSYQLLRDLVVEPGRRLSDQLLAPLAATLQDRCSFKKLVSGHANTLEHMAVFHHIYGTDAMHFC